VHQAACSSAVDLNNQNPEQRIEVSWDTSRDQSFIVQLDLMVEDRKNMLRDVSQAIADVNTNVRGAEMYANEDSTAQGRFVIEVTSLSHLNRVIDKVKRIKGVLSVRRGSRPDSETSIPQETD
jgi:(p)ppGpp synthase/HD superfamily hydrolase